MPGRQGEFTPRDIPSQQLSDEPLWPASSHRLVSEWASPDLQDGHYSQATARPILQENDGRDWTN